MAIIRRLELGEGLLYRSIPLEALRDSPDAFSAKYEDALARSEKSWIAQADSSSSGSDRATFVIIDEQPCGLGAVYRDANEAKVGELIQMWVSPKHRGSSAANGLLSEIFHWAARNGFSRIKAEVQKDTDRALRFYEKFGFKHSDDMSLHSESSIMLTKGVDQDRSDNG